VAGESRLIRDGKTIWKKPFLSGETNMSHTVANLEFHHFKYAQFRRPGDVHIHFFGAATLSFADGIRTEPGDLFEIEMQEFGAPLRNRLGKNPRPVSPMVASPNSEPDRIMTIAAIFADWGTTNRRAWAVDRGGAVLDRRQDEQGLLGVQNRAFQASFRAFTGDWLAAAEPTAPVIMGGMVGSKLGWKECPIWKRRRASPISA